MKHLYLTKPFNKGECYFAHETFGWIDHIHRAEARKYVPNYFGPTSFWLHVHNLNRDVPTNNVPTNQGIHLMPEQHTAFHNLNEMIYVA